MSMSKRIRAPRTGRGWLFVAAAGAVLAVGAFAAVYITMFGGSAAAPLALSKPATTTAAASLTSSQPPGTWTVTTGSVAGYRVREKLAFLPAPSDAVGRTSAIAGSATLSGSPSALTVSAATFTANATTLTSDQSRRDNRLKTSGIETDKYPATTFTLTSPIALPATASDGSAFSASAAGQLTLHGITRAVTIPIKARVSGSTVELVGSITFPFSQFNVTPPNVLGFVSVQDNATLEFDLKLRRG